ncbi:calcium-binding protein [Alloyangia pacifica]|uniref:calcium-binding protein n=1 Tax=Alloyangia pacifica TaxID=311180 RepID=UPI001CD368D9|nr:calcium-binding protein [Alloyangia pacifica]MCA0995302.1 calcium-binding protein [Alloyangia pacifica]
MFRRLLKAAILAAGWPLAALAQEREVYVFGNSLVHFLGQEAHSNTPYWLSRLAEAGGGELALDGQWGFLRDFSDGLPPEPNWSIPGVANNWDPGRGSFGDAGYDAVLITPANFLQYQAADAPYPGNNPGNTSPLDAILTVADWIEGHAPSTPLWVYEGWPDMASVAGDYPPSARGLRKYHDFTLGTYGVWYDDLLDKLGAARPEQDLHLIPVARVIAGLLGDGGLLQDLPVEALYVDDAPHGTPSLYFLAAMVSYSALYSAPPPAAYVPPPEIAPEITAAYGQIAEQVWQTVSDLAPRQKAAAEAPEAQIQTAAAETTADTASETTPEAVPEAPLPQRPDLALPDPGARPEGDPALAMGLNGLSDWSTQMPFVDLMKSAREWIGHLPGQWGGVEIAALRAQGVLDENGWPLRIPEGVERLEALLLTDQPEEAVSLRGTYVVLWQGKGDLQITGRASRVRMEEGRALFDYAPGEGSVGISISATDPEDPIRDIHVVREDQMQIFEAGALFNPHWLARIRDLRSLRFMDWMMTNGSPVMGWDDRPRSSDYTWTAWGVPPEVMIELANEIGADPWFTLPHMADDDYVRRFAELVKARLDPRLKAYVEYSNEVWNFVFPQAHWAAQQAEARWGRSESGWIQFYGLRAAQVMDIWSEVYGDEAKDRLVRVVSTHTGWPGLEEQILTAPLAYLALGHQPAESFDAYAVTGYFGYELGGEEMAGQVEDWLSRAEMQAQEDGEAQGLRRVALREYVKRHRFDAAMLPVAMALQDGALAELTGEIFPYHAEVAEKAGLRLVMYEGGTHAAAQAERVQDERLTAFFEAFSYTPEMAKLYEQLLSGWVNAGGTLFNAFVDVAPASQWGSWGALRHLDDDNPRWDMLMSYNASGPTGWEDRAAGTFEDGLMLRADAEGARLEGSERSDILLGGAGDDVLVSGGGSDKLHGGAGQDHALLPGARDDYAFSRDGQGRLLAEGPRDRITLFAIETLSFEKAPETELPTSGL